MMKTIDKSAVNEIRKYLGRFHILTANARSETALFVQRSNQAFHSL